MKHGSSHVDHMIKDQECYAIAGNLPAKKDYDQDEGMFLNQLPS